MRDLSLIANSPNMTKVSPWLFVLFTFVISQFLKSTLSDLTKGFDAGPRLVQHKIISAFWPLFFGPV